VATVLLPRNLLALFPTAVRQLEVETGTVEETIDLLNERWPGLRNRLVDAGPSLREHILVFVDGEKADLATAVKAESEIRIVPSITGGMT
jgi:molybdopterin converting factor small subunit